MCLIPMSNCNRWTDPIKVSNREAITELEMERIRGGRYKFDWVGRMEETFAVIPGHGVII